MKRSLLAVASALLALAATPHGQTPRAYDIGNGVTSPKVIKIVDPIYTTRAQVAKLTGEVHVRAVVATDGTLINVRLDKSCLGRTEITVPVPDPISHSVIRPSSSFPCVDPPAETTTGVVPPDESLGLHQAALDAARQWLFQPGTRNGAPVAVNVELILEFRLK